MSKIIFKSNKDSAESWNNTLAHCKRIVVPRDIKISGDELVRHVIDKYDAVENTLEEGTRLALKVTVLANFYPFVFEQIKEAIPDHFSTAKLIPDEKYALRFASLRIPRNPKNKHFFKELDNEREEIIFDIELSTGYFQLNGSRLLMHEIILWKGVTQEDIDNCTPTFIGYAAAMRDTGKI